MKNNKQKSLPFALSGALMGALVAAMLPALLWPVQAGAQDIASGFAGFSQKSNEPINIEADSLEVLDDKKFAIFSGNVKARQGKFELVAKKLKVTYIGGAGSNKNEAKGIKKIDATGKVAISTPDGQSATSDWAKFDVVARMVTIGGNVVLSQGGNVMRGNKLIIDLKTGRSKLDSTSTARKNGKPRRIRGVFMPGKSNGKNPFGTATKRKTQLQKRSPGKKSELPWRK